MAGGGEAGCVAAMKATSQGAYQGENPLDFALPLAILQICLVVVVTRGLAYLLRPLRQPRVIAEIIVSLIFLLSSPPPARPGGFCSRLACRSATVACACGGDFLLGFIGFWLWLRWRSAVLCAVLFAGN
jgi:hypothetical protein